MAELDRGAPRSVEPRDCAVRVCEWLRARQITDDRLALGGERVTIPRSDGWSAQVDRGTVMLVAPSGSTREVTPGDLVVVPSAPASAPRRNEATRDETSPARGSGRSVVVRRVLDELRGGRLDRGSRSELVATIRRFGPQMVRAPGGLGADGGLVWRVGHDELICWDRGGFWDDNPNTEADAWAPQAMGMYYADAYAGAAFALLAVDDDQWAAPARAALEHVGRTYHDYPRAPIWYHHEFKNAPYLEGARSLGIDESRFGAAAAALHGDTYEPTNVMAVRLHWLAARGLATTGDRHRYERALVRLQQAQAPSGLVLDDRPHLTRGVHDIAYHQFTMAFLARTLELRDDPAVAELLRRGLEHTIHVQVGDGAIAITGRGAANTYHAACAVYALAAGAARFGDDAYRVAAGRAFRWLGRWQHPDGSFPVAANDRPDARMGWNHCATPYNALIAYLLLQAARYGVSADDGASRHVSASRPRLRGRVARLDAGLASAAVVGGYDGGHAWSGCHRPGVAGLAALTVGDEMLTLAVDELVDGIDVTDLPDVTVDGVRIDWRVAGRLAVEGSAVRYEVDHHGVRAGAVYRLDDQALSITSFVRSRRTVTVDVAPRVALLARTPVDLVDGPHGRPERIDVPSNPRGPGALLRWPTMALTLAVGELWEAEVRVRLSPIPVADG
ncbi:MAG: hypothetical protein QOG30_261 [Acidimicrobiaceae bacterium]